MKSLITLMVFLILAPTVKAADALPLETFLWKIGNPALSEQDLEIVKIQLAKFNKNPHMQMAGEVQRVHMKYMCVGGKASLVILGLQGFKCVNTAGNVIVITHDPKDNSRTSPFTGLQISDYVGLNAGLSLMAGIAVYSCDLGNCAIEGDYEYSRFDSEENARTHGRGGTINGAFGLYGGYVGFYKKDQNSLALLMYQAGLAAEISYSAVQVTAQR